MNWLLSLPLPYIISFLVVIFVVVLTYFLWLSGVFENKSRQLKEGTNSYARTKVKHSGTGDVVMGDKKIYTESKKKDISPKLKGIDFYPRWRNRNLSVKKGSLDQVIICIENSIKTSYHHDEKFWYEVDSSRSEFYNPKTHDMKFNGYVVHGIKNDIVIKEDGVIKKVVGSEEKIANMFALKIESAGFKQKVRIHVRLDSDYLYAESFFDDVQRALENKFGKENVILQS
jgi:hypothetical protein